MNRIEFYVALIVIVILFGWALYVLDYSSKVELQETINKVDSLEVQMKILEETTKQDTIIINLNLQKNGN